MDGPTPQYDVITVGGGMAGASLAVAMAQRGARVLVVERTSRFTDRVRGEAMHPWGVSEVQALGLWPTYTEGGAHELPYWRYHPPRVSLVTKTDTTGVRHLPSTTPSSLPEVSFYHPTIQEGLLRRAETAGAEAWRGATVQGVRPGYPASVVVRRAGRDLELTTRLIVAADGRGSAARGWGGFRVERDPDSTMIAGLLFDDLDLDDTAIHGYRSPPAEGSALLFPQGAGRVRVYLIYPTRSELRLSGPGDVEIFIKRCVSVGIPETVLRRAKPVGPLASFNAADHWVTHPYAAGVALVGDAATSSNPGFGMGLSLAARDVRLLRDRLLESSNWEEAGHGYAADHDRYYATIRRWHAWVNEMNQPQGPAADDWRAKITEVCTREPDRVPDVVLGGPDIELDERLKIKFFADDIAEIARAREAAFANQA